MWKSNTRSIKDRAHLLEEAFDAFKSLLVMFTLPFHFVEVNQRKNTVIYKPARLASESHLAFSR